MIRCHNGDDDWSLGSGSFECLHHLFLFTSLCMCVKTKKQKKIPTLLESFLKEAPCQSASPPPWNWVTAADMWPSGSKTNLDSLGLGSAKMLVKCVHVRAGGCIILARFNPILWYFNKQKTSVYSNLIFLCISFIYFYNFQLMSHQWTFWNLRNMQDFYQRLSSGHKDVVVNVVNTFIYLYTEITN